MPTYFAPQHVRIVICLQIGIAAKVPNFLSKDQEDLAIKFARPGEDRFKDIPSHPDRNAVPLLEGCSGILNCVVESTYPGGDHIIIVGRVLRFREEKNPPLLFHKGKFKSF